MEQKWILKSLTIWGVVVATITGLVPAINALVPGLDLTPEFILSLDTAVKSAINAAGILIGLVLVVMGRLQSKTELVLRPTEEDKKQLKKLVFRV